MNFLGYFTCPNVESFWTFYTRNNIIEKSAGQSLFWTSKHRTRSGFPLKFLIVKHCLFKEKTWRIKFVPSPWLRIPSSRCQLALVGLLLPGAEAGSWHLRTPPRPSWKTQMTRLVAAALRICSPRPSWKIQMTRTVLDKMGAAALLQRPPPSWKKIEHLK